MQASQDTEKTLVLDIGGTCIKSAVFQYGAMHCRLPQIPSCSNGAREEIAEAIRRAIRQAGQVARVAVSLPGPFDYGKGIFLAEHKFASVKGCVFTDFTEGLPAVCIHDANAFLLGELRHGAGRGFRRVGGITLGTGLGASIAIDGILQNNALGSPTAQVSLWNRPYLDGIAEDYVSAHALLKAFPDMNGKALAEAASSGNMQAKHAWEEYSRHLIALLREWKAELAPEVIILGGQLSKGLHLGLRIPADLNVRFTELGEDSALWGAFEESARRSTPKQ